MTDCIIQSSHYCLARISITSRSRSPAFPQPLPIAPHHGTLSLCPRDEFCRSILNQFWEPNNVNILPGQFSPRPALHSGSLQSLINDCARNSQSIPLMLLEFKLLFQRQIFKKKKKNHTQKHMFFTCIHTRKRTFYTCTKSPLPSFSCAFNEISLSFFFFLNGTEYV